jgi:IS605 OrfB family transposase
MKYKVSTYAKIHGVTMRTVWNWINKGELEIERTSTGRIRIVVDENKEKTIAVYARVSSSENKSNLIAQKDRVVSYCMAKGYKISKVVMEAGSGLNDKRPKLEDLLKDNNQNFVNIPHAVFIEMVCYKCKLNGIEVVLREESYTSKCSFIDNEPIKKHDSYAGRRVKRGLFRSENGTFINADLNGALNILRKEVGEFNYNPIEVCSSPKKLRIGLS